MSSKTVSACAPDCSKERLTLPRPRARAVTHARWDREHLVGSKSDGAFSAEVDLERALEHQKTLVGVGVPVPGILTGHHRHPHTVIVQTTAASVTSRLPPLSDTARRRIAPLGADPRFECGAEVGTHEKVAMPAGEPVLN